MSACRLFIRLTRVPSFLLLLLHLFGGSTWNVSREGGGRGGRRSDGEGPGARGGGGGGSVRGQEFPSRDEAHFQFIMKHPEVIVDTKSLPDGKEETVYLDKGKPTRLFFVVESDAAILSVVVSSCSSRISWMFYYLYPTPNEGHQKNQEEDDEILQQGKASASSSSSSSSSSNRKNKDHRLLESYTGSDVSGFESVNPDPGVYSLVLVNGDQDGSVRVFASTSPQSDNSFPLAPNDRTIRIASSYSTAFKSSFHFPFSSAATSSSPFSGETIDSSKIQLTWKRSPSEEWHRQPIEYCLSSNNFAHLKTYCAARALALGDPRPTLPPYAGFGTPRNRTRSSGPRRSGGRQPRGSKQRVRLTCVRSKTSFTFSATPSALVNRKSFYIDVFAVNRRTQSSVTYTGVQLKPITRRRLIQLKFKEVKTVRLKTSSDYVLFQFKADRSPLTSSTLLFSFRACVGLVRVEISRDDEMLYENRTSEGRPLQFLATPTAPSDTYDIMISNDGKGSASFQVIVSPAATEQFPFPDIPVDVGIRVVEADCHSLKLVWSESNTGHTDYCVVVEPLHSIGWTRNRCMIPRPSTDKTKILCHPTRFSDLDLHDPLHHNQTVTDLERETSYRLTIYVRNRNGSQYISYLPIVGATRQKCRSQIYDSH